MNNFRLLQLVVFACTCLLMLKTVSFVLSDGSGNSVVSGAVSLNAQEAIKKAEIGEKKEASAVMGPMPEEAKVDKSGADKKDKKSANNQLKPESVTEKKFLSSSSELDLLESLSVRRKQLNERESQLVLKENLLQAAERRIDERIKQLKIIEAKIQVDLKKQDVLRDGQYKRLVKIYTSMKPKEAARIFDGLQTSILVDLMRAMKAAAGSQILAKMQSEKARELTLLLVKKDQLVAVNNHEPVNELPSVRDEKPADKNQ